MRDGERKKIASLGQPGEQKRMGESRLGVAESWRRGKPGRQENRVTEEIWKCRGGKHLKSHYPILIGGEEPISKRAGGESFAIPGKQRPAGWVQRKKNQHREAGLPKKKKHRKGGRPNRRRQRTLED